MGLLQKMFAKQIAAAQQQWQQNMTEADLDKLEQQGCDVTELRKQFTANQQAKAQREQEMRDAIVLDKLEPYKKALTSEFVGEVAKLNKMSQKSALAMLNSGAPLVYGRVVQAHGSLFKAGAEDGYSYGIVFLFALDEAHKYDIEWLARTTEAIQAVRKGAIKDAPADCQDFIRKLCDDRSSFCFKLGESLSGGANAWCTTFTFTKPSALPFGCIPANRIVPLLLSEPPREHYLAQLQLIPPKYYIR